MQINWIRLGNIPEYEFMYSIKPTSNNTVSSDIQSSTPPGYQAQASNVISWVFTLFWLALIAIDIFLALQCFGLKSPYPGTPSWRYYAALIAFPFIAFVALYILGIAIGMLGYFLGILGTATPNNTTSANGILMKIAVLATLVLAWEQNDNLINLYNLRFGQTVTVRGTIYKREYKSLSSSKHSNQTHVQPTDLIRLDQPPVKEDRLSIQLNNQWISGSSHDVEKNVPVSAKLSFSWIGISLLDYKSQDIPAGLSSPSSSAPSPAPPIPQTLLILPQTKGRVIGLAQRDNLILACTDAGDVLISEDGGEHWEARSSGKDSLAIENVAILPDHSLVLRSGYVLKISADHGETWQTRSIHFPDEKEYDSPPMIEMSSTGILGIYTPPLLLISTDQGKGWQKKSENSSLPLLTASHINTVISNLPGYFAQKLSCPTDNLTPLNIRNDRDIERLFRQGCELKPDYDQVHDTNFRHWILTTENQGVRISHDFGKTFVPATLPPVPAEDQQEQWLKAQRWKNVQASAISDDGKMAVLIFGIPSERPKQQSLLHVLVAYQGGTNFQDVGTIPATRIAGISITDPDKHEFVVHLSSRLGVAIANEGVFEVRPTKNAQTHLARRAPHGLILGGERLMRFGEEAMQAPSPTKLTEANSRPMHTP